jgi:SAM-dependent methyltransferase
MTMDTSPRLRCPKCHLGQPLASPDRRVQLLICSHCGAAFPNEDNVAILVADATTLEADIARARDVNPDWYLTEQPMMEASPWRHHIKKRKDYVEQVFRRELAARGVAKAGSVLDLGCGDGTTMHWLSPFAGRLYGSDYNAVRLARARKRFPEANLFLANILDYPAEDNSFDVVFFNHVIEHIPDDERALAEAYRILAPGGFMILGTPNEGSWWWQLAYKRAPDILASTDHVHFYTGETIAARTRDAGFTVTEVKHLGWGPPDFRLDGKLRQYKMLDDLFEVVGRTLLPRQASSLYIVATKNA